MDIAASNLQVLERRHQPATPICGVSTDVVIGTDDELTRDADAFLLLCEMIRDS